MKRALKSVPSNASTQAFDYIRLSIASPERIRSWSFGEVKRPETINYRTYKPERDGLFCSRIFGPVKDYECLCGKYKRMKYKGIICEKCGVEVTLAKVRRERMGHIELACPIAHIWFTRAMPSRVAILLDMTLKDIERVLYFEAYVVLEPGLTPLKKQQLITEEEYVDALDAYGDDAFTVSIGAEAIRVLLGEINLQKESAQLREDLKETSSELRRKKYIKRLKVMDAFIQSGSDPRWMIMSVIPVIPPELRPLVPLDGGRFATSDLNDLYRRVINRNNRLKRLIDLKAPDIIIRNEKRMLQEAVDALFDNSRRSRPIAGANKRPLKSLSDMLKGKQGRFRQNLLGKRVDYSGRSVIVAGPNLKLQQCGLPKKMALELFKPFVYARLERYGLASTIKSAKKLVEREKPEVWDILEEVIRQHPVLLNRAPTLHRLGIQAFEPVLVEGKAIQLHPLVCAAFNADFDGDQMAVHVPLSIESQLEARTLMMSSNNILHPANGCPIIVPTKDMILGLYYLTMEEAEDLEQNQVTYFSTLGEIEQALEQKHITLHSKIRFRKSVLNEQGERERKLFDTTPGRVILGEFLPEHPQVPFESINQLLTSGKVSDVLDLVYRHCGQKETVIFADRLKELGFKYATRSGTSFGKDDMIVPADKAKLVQQTQEKVSEYEKQYWEGFITQGEKYNKVVDAWTQCSENVASAMMKEISATPKGGKINSIYMMAHSKARGAPAQIKQLAGMRGLMTKPSGEIIERPIISNFKEGLNVIEYFTSTHGARKGLSDTALKTANSGYLTRRLVDVAQDCVITEDDCGTEKSITVQAIVEGAEVITSLPERLLGRTLAEDITDLITGEILIPKGEIVQESQVKLLKEATVDSVKIRSILTCESETGICATCYGRDLARGNKVNIGEAIGVVAAQSIGEPGTQLTMRTFHIGGTAQGAGEKSSIEASFDAKIKITDQNIIETREGNLIVMGRYCEIALLDRMGRERGRHKVPYGARLLFRDGESVKGGQKIAEWDPFTVPIVAECDGYVHYMDLVEGLSLKEKTDETTGITNAVVSDWNQQARGADLKPSVALKTKEGEALYLSSGAEAKYHLPVDAILNVENGAAISIGDVIARIPRESSKTRDITGGLPRVAELFEARIPKDFAIISEVEGRVEFGKDYKSKRRIRVIPKDDTIEPKEYLVPKGRHILVFEGDNVRKGEMLVDGNPVPHDILRILGIEALAGYLINEIQEVYRLQGVPINDKHIEVIVRQMLQKTEIADPGDSAYAIGEQVNVKDFEMVNEKILAEGGVPAKGIRVLQGITRASLQTQSFFSAASFQDTTRILTEAAIEGKIDELVGLKENIIVGRLIPVGSGSYMKKVYALSKKRDKEILANNA